MIHFTKEQQELLQQIYEHYGTANQVLHCVEEISELQLELSRWMSDLVDRHPEAFQDGHLLEEEPRNASAIQEEIADSLICIAKLGPAVDWDAVAAIVDFKIRRQIKRIAAGDGDA